jgi:hypothetical protein
MIYTTVSGYDKDTIGQYTAPSYVLRDLNSTVTTSFRCYEWVWMRLIRGPQYWLITKTTREVDCELAFHFLKYCGAYGPLPHVEKVEEIGKAIYKLSSCVQIEFRGYYQLCGFR